VPSLKHTDWPLGAPSIPAPNLQPTANQERNDQCRNQHFSREFLMMGIVMPETCLAYKKYNKIISGIYLVFYSSVFILLQLIINIKFLIFMYLNATFLSFLCIP